MKNIMKTPFHPSLFDLGRMRREAQQIARDIGFSAGSGEEDAFRHAYVSAKVQESFGSTVAHVEGQGVEYLRNATDRTRSLGRKSNPSNEWAMDEGNNAFGRSLEKELSRQNLSPDEKEYQLRLQIAEAIKAKKLVTNPEKIIGTSRPIIQGIENVFHSASIVARGGDVSVKGYSRGTGSVKSHTRSRPDGDKTNNFSFRK